MTQNRERPRDGENSESFLYSFLSFNFIHTLVLKIFLLIGLLGLLKYSTIDRAFCIATQIHLHYMDQEEYKDITPQRYSSSKSEHHLHNTLYNIYITCVCMLTKQLN